MSDLIIRPATPDDMRYLWEWRNEPTARAMFRNSEKVGWKAHVAWFAERMKDARSLILIGTVRGVPAGAVRFDADGTGGALISIVMDAKYRGQGLGTSLLGRACAFAIEKDFCDVFIAEVKADNVGSQRIFERNEFQRVETRTQWYVYQRIAKRGSRRS